MFGLRHSSVHIFRVLFKEHNSRSLQRSGWSIGFLPYQQFIIVLLCGALAALSMAPLFWWPAAVAGYSILLWQLYHTTPHMHARQIWGFFFAYFAVSLHWLVYPMLVQPELFAVFIPLAIVGLPAALALLHSSSMWLCTTLGTRTSVLVQFVCAITMAEYIRGRLFTGFPWNIPSHMIGTTAETMQLAHIANIDIWIPWVVLWCALPAFMYYYRVWWCSILWILTPCLVYTYGAHRLKQVLPITQTLKLHIVQPNIAQKIRMQPNGARIMWHAMLQHSNPPADVTHIIWPEAVLPPTDNVRAWLQQVPLLPHQSLIAGGVIFDNTQVSPTNSLILHNQMGTQRYNKVHLVPFGEFLPFDTWLNRLGLRVLIDLPKGFAAGTDRAVLQDAQTPAFLPLICYESIFAHEITSHDGQWIVIVTNDSWFGTWAGPAQHLLQAQFRAIEQELPVARAAVTGTSAIINAYGQVTYKLDTQHTGALTAPLYLHKNPLLKIEKTKNAILICLIFAALILLINRYEKKLVKNTKNT